MFETINDADLVRTNGGAGAAAAPSGVRLTQFGYRSDPYMDSETRKGHGAYSNLSANRSVALTDSSPTALGLTKSMVRHEHPWIGIHLQGGGVLPAPYR